MKPSEADILSILNGMEAHLPCEVADVIRELIDHNEAGAALETLCSWICELGIVISELDKAKLRDAAGWLGIAVSRLEGLSA